MVTIVILRRFFGDISKFDDFGPLISRPCKSPLYVTYVRPMNNVSKCQLNTYDAISSNKGLKSAEVS